MSRKLFSVIKPTVIADESFKGEINGQPTLTPAVPGSHIDYYTLITYWILLALLASFVWVLSPHYPRVHGQFTGCDVPLNFRDVLWTKREINTLF